MSLFVSAKASHAATFYVATTGNDANPGTAAAPFRTLLKGVQSLSAGDTLIVKGGTYAEGLANISSGRAGGPTTIQAAPGEKVILQPNNINVDCIVAFRANQNYITIDGLIIDGGSPDGTKLSGFPVCNEDAGSPSTTTSHLTVKNSEVKNGRHSGFLIVGAVWELRNNHIHHNGTDNTYDHGVYFEADHSLVTGNVFDNNACYNLQNYSSAGANPTNNTFTNNTFTSSSCGVTLPHGDNHLFMNNLIYGDATSGTSGALLGFGSNTKVYNNTIINNLSPGIITINNGNDHGAQVKNNIVYNNAGGNISTVNATVSNNLTTNPGFVDAAHGNFRPAVGSAAINAGVTLSEVAVDLDNVPRPQGAGYDIGAYEYRTGSVPAPVPAPRNMRVVSQP
jgi:hypothetical protein